MVAAAALTLLLSQLPIEKQPPREAMVSALQAARARRPADAKALLAVKQGPIDASLAGDLLTLDWYQPGNWSYPEKTFSPNYLDEKVFQYDLRRYRPDGGELSFSYVINLRDESVGVMNHTNFEAPHTSATVVKVGKQTYLELTAWGTKELHRVVSYEKGVLVVDVSYDGKANSKTVKFRDVWIALPRLFESTGK